MVLVPGASTRGLRQKAFPLQTTISICPTYINPLVAEHIREVYERLSEPELLRRCIEGKTQNANESIHALIWSRCPMHVSVGMQRMEISVALGVGEFNQGARASQKFISSLGFNVGPEFSKLGKWKDHDRRRKAERNSAVVVKETRDIRRLAQVREEEGAGAGGRWRAVCCRWKVESSMLQVEGGEQYAAGGRWRAVCCRWKVESSMLQVLFELLTICWLLYLVSDILPKKKKKTNNRQVPYLTILFVCYLTTHSLWEFGVHVF